MDTMFNVSLKWTIMYFTFMLIFPTTIILLSKLKKREKQFKLNAFIDSRNKKFEKAYSMIGMDFMGAVPYLGVPRNIWETEDGKTIYRYSVSNDEVIQARSYKDVESYDIYIDICVNESNIIESVNKRSILKSE